jgi:hypothetical protein
MRAPVNIRVFRLWNASFREFQNGTALRAYNSWSNLC